MDLILIRHGQSQWNFDQTGGEDAPLTALGREQARRAGIYCRSQFKVSALYSSTYLRARHTAEIINSFLGFEHVPAYDDLREFLEDYSPQLPQFASPLEGLRVTEPVRPAYVSDYYITFQERVMRAVEEILWIHKDEYDSEEQVAIVSHGGVMGTIVRTLAGSHHFSLTTENTGMHILRWEDRRWHLVALNRVEHLRYAQWEHEEGKDA
jgi:broad specificity phosphatase PhoE